MKLKTLTSVGKSKLKNSFDAGKRAAEDALNKLDGRTPNLALVFATVSYDQNELLNGIKSVLKNTPITGCSAEGVITAEGSDESSHAISVMLFASEKIKFDVMHAQGLLENSAKCGAEIARQVNSNPNFSSAKALIVMPDGLTTNCTLLIESLKKNLKKDLLILGGSAADRMGGLTQTYQYHNDIAYSDSISAFLLSGDIHINFEISHGCDPLGLDLTVTKSASNQLQEIDGRKPWEVFKEYLNDDPTDLLGSDVVHLSIGERLDHSEAEKYNQYIIRSPLQLDKNSGYITTATEFKPGTKIRMTRRDPDRVAASAVKAAHSIRERSENKEPFAILQLDCAARGGLLFGQQTNEKIMFPMQKLLGHLDHWIGFHTYGEIAPVAEKTYFHTYTVILCALYEIG